MIEILSSLESTDNVQKLDRCLELRGSSQKVSDVSFGQIDKYKNTVDDDDGPHSLHIINIGNEPGAVEAYARLVPSEAALTDDCGVDQSAITPFRWVEPASLWLLQRVSIVSTVSERRLRLLRETLLAALECCRENGIELVGGVATPDAIAELSGMGLNVVTIGKQFEDTDRTLVRYHFACDDKNRAALRPLSLVGPDSGRSEQSEPQDDVMRELARLAAAHQTRTQVKVALRLVASDRR